MGAGSELTLPRRRSTSCERRPWLDSPRHRLDHAGTLAARVATDGFGVRRTAPTMAALTTRIDTTPTHWRASPMPSPQYGFVGPASTGTRWKNPNATISIQATTAATRAADRCLNASRTPAIRTATRLARCWGLANVSRTPADESMRRSSKTTRLRMRSPRRAPVRLSSSLVGAAEALAGCAFLYVVIAAR